MLTFNYKGHLVPNTNIRSDLGEFKAEFVDAFDNSKRTALFGNYLRYSAGLKAIVGEDLLQWVDGSYVTKKAEPEDIDLITFIDEKIVDEQIAALERFKYPKSVEIYGVDGYLVKVYESEDRRYPLFIGDRFYWMDHFDQTRRTRSGQRHPKGFLELIY